MGAIAKRGQEDRSNRLDVYKRWVSSACAFRRSHLSCRSCRWELDSFIRLLLFLYRGDGDRAVFQHDLQHRVSAIQQRLGGGVQGLYVQQVRLQGSRKVPAAAAE